jgi:hypothetical protein
MVSPADFQEAFAAAFTVHRRHLLWDQPRRRMANMTAYIYRTIAECFPGIEIEYEHKCIDAVLYRGSCDDAHIEVAIEHENDLTKIEQEITNLQHYPYPLNVVITYCGNVDLWIYGHMTGLLTHTAWTQPLLVIYAVEPPSIWEHRRGDKIPWASLLYEQGTWRPL